MIRLREIKKALTELLKANFPYKVHFDNVEKAKESYFYIELSLSQRTVDRVIFTRDIDVRIAFVPMTDDNGRINRSQVYDVHDNLDEIIRPVFHVGDRFITVLNASSEIRDDVLHYTFNLPFADCQEHEDDHEEMQEIKIVFNKE